MYFLLLLCKICCARDLVCISHCVSMLLYKRSLCSALYIQTATKSTATNSVISIFQQKSLNAEDSLGSALDFVGHFKWWQTTWNCLEELAGSLLLNYALFTICASISICYWVYTSSASLLPHEVLTPNFLRNCFSTSVNTIFCSTSSALVSCLPSTIQNMWKCAHLFCINEM